eukprot:12923164-Ditylum_brightwellii.AAC.1
MALYHEKMLSDIPWSWQEMGKSLLKLGGLLKQPKLAKTLELAIKHGADAIYTINLTQHIVKDIQNAGGMIMESDLK